MSRIRRKSNAKSIVSLVIVIAILLAAIGGITAWAKSETKTVPTTAFTRGSLNEADGAYVKGKTSIVTEDLFECKGLKVIPDFDNTAQYQVFWYNEDEIYLGATDKLGSSTKMVGSVPGAAVYARVVIYPEQVDDNGKAIKDFEIKVWQIAKYKKSIKIEVARDQEALQQNLFVSSIVYDETLGSISSNIQQNRNILLNGYSLYHGQESNIFEENFFVETGNYDYLILDCSNVSVYSIFYDDNYSYEICFYDSNGDFISNLNSSSCGVTLIETPLDSDVSSIFVGVPKGEVFRISEYLYRELL